MSKNPLSMAAMRRSIAQASGLRCVNHTVFPEHVGIEYAIVKHQTRSLKLQPNDGRPGGWIYFNRMNVVDEQTFQTLDAEGAVRGTYQLIHDAGAAPAA